MKSKRKFNVYCTMADGKVIPYEEFIKGVHIDAEGNEEVLQNIANGMRTPEESEYQRAKYGRYKERMEQAQRESEALRKALGL